ncbi:hypothetical protein BC834DRAFT_837080 [Gloeopeniophorella convolvens]|nr:hypothetical protein BC834DRAFT_837080 [Gloeopeniophorella convolvens]
MPAADLPVCGERTAPTFDDKKPRELARYFEDLEYLFTKFQVIDPAEMKKAAIRYLDIDTADLWKTAPEYGDAGKTYDQFKVAIHGLYPGSTGDRRYTIKDLELLVSNTAQAGLSSSNDLGDYYRQFLSISQYLIIHNRLSTQEQSRLFRRGFNPELNTRVDRCLEVKYPDHHPDDPFDLAVIREAASFVLLGSTADLAIARTQGQAQATTGNPTTGDPTTVKLEQLAVAVTILSETVKAFAVNQQGSPGPSGRPRPSGGQAAGQSAGNATQSGGGMLQACNFCGNPNHFIRNCEVVEEYIRTGKCRRDIAGKVVLPTGAFVPSEIRGTWLRERVDEWRALVIFFVK